MKGGPYGRVSFPFVFQVNLAIVLTMVYFGWLLTGGLSCGGFAEVDILYSKMGGQSAEHPGPGFPHKHKHKHIQLL